MKGMKFGQRYYYLNSNWDTKPEAEKQAKFLRSKGHPARVVRRRVKKRIFYSVFARVPAGVVTREL